MECVKGAFKFISPLGNLKDKTCNKILFSPKGKFMVIIELGHFNSTVEFFDVDNFSTLNFEELFGCIEVKWDPSGRYLAIINNVTHQTEHSISLWSCFGRQLYRLLRDGLVSFEWRARPKISISSESERQISKEIKIYSKKYEKEDQIMFQKKIQQVIQRRKILQRKFENWMDGKIYFSSERKKEIQIKHPGFFEDRNEKSINIFRIEELVERKEKEIS